MTYFHCVSADLKAAGSIVDLGTRRSLDGDVLLRAEGAKRAVACMTGSKAVEATTSAEQLRFG